MELYNLSLKNLTSMKKKRRKKKKLYVTYRGKFQQQYSRQNCILIHGISVEKSKDMDKQALEIIRGELGETVAKSNLDRPHRIGAFKEDS